MKAKTHLRQDLRAAVLNRILSGELPPGGRVKELRLAKELGVSRTPLREALLHLEREGFLRSDLSKGFSVLPLTAQEAQELYPILWTLECLALSATGATITLVVPELKRLNRQFKQAGSEPAKARDLDQAWHTALLSRCPNRKLLALICGQRSLVSRYERVYMEDAELPQMSVQQHAEIIAALEKGDLKNALAVLELNWRFGMEALLLKLGKTAV